MNNVASLALCSELLELSGWEDTHAFWRYADDVSFNGEAGWGGDAMEYFRQGRPYDDTPAYDLGFMLRKLPEWIDWHLAPNPGVGYFISGPVDENIPRADAETPEDAVAKFCIKLFKQGILTKELIRE